MARLVRTLRQRYERLTALMFAMTLAVYFALPANAHAILDAAYQFSNSENGDKGLPPVDESKVKPLIDFANHLTADGTLLALPFVGLAGIAVGFKFWSGNPQAASDLSKLVIGFGIIVSARALAL
jgi:hypothetical protein